MSINRIKTNGRPIAKRTEAMFETLEIRQLLSASPARGVVNNLSPQHSGSSNVSASPRRVIGYLPEYRFSTLSHIDFTALTHINYFSIAATATGSLDTSGINLTHLVAARDAAHAAGVTISITVGPQTFSTIASATTSLNNFVNNLITFVQANGLDGVDLDWEPPEANSTDKARYGTLIDALYAQAHPLGLLLSAAVNPITTEIPVPEANELDWINVMAYDFDYANHSPYASSVNSLVHWNSYGVPKDKLVLGVPFYSRAGTSWNNSVTNTYGAIVDAYRTANGSFPSPSTDLINGQYFNGPTTMAAKSQYVIDNNYGGVMVWELGQDHFSTQGTYDAASLLPVIKSVIQPAQDLTAPQVASKSFLFETGHSVQITFSEDVIGSVNAADLTVQNLSDGSAVSITSSTYDPATLTATFTLPNSIADGRYRATLAAHSVEDRVGNSLATDSSLDFNVRAGDVNGDHSVDFSDLVIVAQNYGMVGRTYSQGNLDYSADGKVDFNDLVILSQHYGTTLPAADLVAADPVDRDLTDRGRRRVN